MKRRLWRCLLCGVLGYGPDERANTRSFYRHYAANHMEKAE